MPSTTTGQHTPMTAPPTKKIQKLSAQQYTAENQKIKHSLFRQLCLEIETSDVDEIQHLLSLIEDLGFDKYGECNKHKENALLHAVYHCGPEVIKVLLNLGFDPHVTNYKGYNALFKAAYYNKLDNLIYLLGANKGFAYNDRGPKNATLLHVAVKGKATEVLNYLIKEYSNDGEFINAQNYFGDNILHATSYTKDKEILKLVSSLGLKAMTNNKNIISTATTEVAFTKKNSSFTDGPGKKNISNAITQFRPYTNKMHNGSIELNEQEVYVSKFSI